jgi:hypothetical protein
LQESTYLVPIVKTSKDFLSKKLLPKRLSPATKDASLPKYLSRPPVPRYALEEILSGQLLERHKEGGT